MVYVPEGAFTMGSEEGSVDEKPIHTVTLDVFWIDRTEVTNAMYALCVQSGVCQSPRSKNSYGVENYYGNSEYADYPVIYVSWNDASAYCEWAGARLPSEAEWEKAARGTDGRTYPWGDGIDKTYANYSGTGTTRVGSYEKGKSPYGVYDMAGNVWEWVADWWGEFYYASSPASNPPGPVSGKYRVLRGGSWYDVDDYVRSAYRGRYVPDGSSYVIGFRCARSR